MIFVYGLTEVECSSASKDTGSIPNDCKTDEWPGPLLKWGLGKWSLLLILRNETSISPSLNSDKDNTNSFCSLDGIKNSSHKWSHSHSKEWNDVPSIIFIRLFRHRNWCSILLNLMDSDNQYQTKDGFLKLNWESPIWANIFSYNFGFVCNYYYEKRIIPLNISFTKKHTILHCYVIW